MKNHLRCCVARHRRGASIILDGVFNHTGADSRHFNRDGNYADVGVCQEKVLPMPIGSRWRKTDHMPAGGVLMTCRTNETSDSFRNFICGEDGGSPVDSRAPVDGADVADELSDGFLAEIHKAAVAERSDAVVIGEVWEDASNKRAYGELKRYFADDELDGTMNYPLRSGVLKYLRGEISASELSHRLEELRENYPKRAFFSSLNLMGSRDARS